MGNFLATVDFLKPDEVITLISLGAESPVALYAMIEAAPEAFSSLLGTEKLEKLTRELQTRISPSEFRVVFGSQATLHPLGALVTTVPEKLLDPGFDVSQRDALYAEMRKLEQLGTPEAKRRATVIRKRLDAMQEVYPLATDSKNQC